MSSIDAVACVRKYFVAASVARGLKFLINMGVIASRFISNPIQMNSQWELIITIIVPDMIVIIRMTEIIGFISTGRVRTNIFGVWAR